MSSSHIGPDTSNPFASVTAILGAIASREIEVSNIRYDIIAKRILDSDHDHVKKVAGSLVQNLSSKEIAKEGTQLLSKRMKTNLTAIAESLKTSRFDNLSEIEQGILNSLNSDVRSLLIRDIEQVNKFIEDRQKELNDAIDALPGTSLPEQEISLIKMRFPVYDETVSVNNDNLHDVLGFAHKTGSMSLLQKCFDLIKSETNITLCSQDPSGPISINITGENNDSEINQLNTYFRTLVDSIGRDNIRINIIQGRNFKVENLKKFVNETSSCIQTLDLRGESYGNEVSDDDLSDLLKNCCNLNHLCITSGLIEGSGLQEIRRLTSLQSLEVLICRNLTTLTLPEGMGSLQTLQVLGSPVKLSFNSTLLSFFTRNPDQIQTFENNPGLKIYFSILNILAIPENSEEPLGDKIQEFRTLIDQSEKLSSLTIYLDFIERKHPVEQLPLLKFIAFTAGLMLILPDEHVAFLGGPIIDSAAPASSEGTPIKDTLLYLIYDHKFAPHRYTLISQAVKIAAENPKKFHSIILGLKNNWTKLAALTLGVQIDEDLLKRILHRIDTNKVFKDNINFNVLISFLCEGIRNWFSDPEITSLTLETLEETLHRGGDILKTLSAYESISILLGRDALVLCIKSKIDPQVYFYNKFIETFGLSALENCTEKYNMTFAKFRDPVALFVYWGRIERLNASDRLVKVGFQEYVTSVLEGNFHELRYDNARSPHLEKNFSGE